MAPLSYTNQVGYTSSMDTATPLPPTRNGWTPERQARFLEALAETASVTTAARRVGMTRQSAYWLRNQPAAVAFRAAWDRALAETWVPIETTALDRAINGEVDTLERDGVRIVRRRPCSPRLLIHMLNRAQAAQARAERCPGAAKPAESVKSVK